MEGEETSKLPLFSYNRKHGHSYASLSNHGPCTCLREACAAEIIFKAGRERYRARPFTDGISFQEPSSPPRRNLGPKEPPSENRKCARRTPPSPQSKSFCVKSLTSPIKQDRIYRKRACGASNSRPQPQRSVPESRRAAAAGAYACKKEAPANAKTADSRSDELIEYTYTEKRDGKLPACIGGKGGTLPVLHFGKDRTQTKSNEP